MASNVFTLFVITVLIISFLSLGLYFGNPFFIQYVLPPVYIAFAFFVLLYGKLEELEKARGKKKAKRR
ncbi:MAG: hypothetical protein ACP5HQ_07045 [Thermoprotei archaeon]